MRIPSFPAHSLVPALALLAGAAGLAACSGGGGSTAPTSVSGLAGPSQVSVVTADDTASGGGGASDGDTGNGSPGAGNYPPGSDYVQDEANLYIYDPSMESLDTINLILCLTSMTAYPDMVNEGNYTALVDESLCNNGSEDDSSTGQSASGATQFALYTVNSSRASATADEIVKMWIPLSDSPPGGGSLIYGKMDLSKGVSSTDPFGAFELSFAAPTDYSSIASDPGMHGGLRTTPANSGNVGFQFYEKFGDVDAAHTNPGDTSWLGAIAVEMRPDQSSGAARISRSHRENFGSGDSGKVSEDWEVVFDATHVQRRPILDGVPGTTVTLSRDTYLDRVFRYNLYDAETGNQVENNSGFGFRTASGEYGWIGYWGMWVPDGVTVSNGDTITRDDQSAMDGEVYTVVKAPGKLIKNTRESLPLTDLAGQVLQWWENGDSLHVDHDGVDFRRIEIWNTVTETWDPITPPTVIDPALAGGYLNMWSDALGGPVTYVDGDSFVTYFEQEFVTGGSDLLLNASGGYVDLYGLVECLDSGITQADAEAGNIYLPDAVDTTVANAHMYRFGENDLTLYYDANHDGSVLTQVGLADGVVPGTGPYTWGMRSGPLVEDLTGLTNVWDIWNVNVFYVYETGANSWNQLAAVEDSTGTPVEFDPPIQILYTHTTANDRNGDSTYDGQKYVLQYNGPGDLFGIPSEGVDLDGDGNEDRWYPVFSMADGTLMGPTGVEYVVRGIEIERVLQEDPAGSPTLDITDASALTLPTDAIYETPAIGTKPTVTDPPAVINGEVIAD